MASAHYSERGIEAHQESHHVRYPAVPAEVRQLDSGYSREARSLLYQAYRHEPTFRYLFEADRPGYDHRVRATVRELVRQHFFQDLPALGLLVQDRLIGIALIARRSGAWASLRAGRGACACC